MKAPKKGSVARDKQGRFTKGKKPGKAEAVHRAADLLTRRGISAKPEPRERPIVRGPRRFLIG